MSLRQRVRPVRTAARALPIAAVVLLSLLATTGCGSEAVARPELELLQTPAGSRDQLPAHVDLQPSFRSVRFVAEVEGVAGVDDATVWAARDDQDQWCVVAAVGSAEDWSAGSSCVDSDGFAEDGAGIGFGGEAATDNLLVRLVPDGFDVEAETGWEQVTDNLLVQR